MHRSKAYGRGIVPVSACLRLPLPSNRPQDSPKWDDGLRSNLPNKNGLPFTAALAPSIRATKDFLKSDHHVGAQDTTGARGSLSLARREVAFKAAWANRPAALRRRTVFVIAARKTRSGFVELASGT